MSLAVCDSCGGVLMTGGILSFSIVPPEQCMMPLHAELAEAQKRTYQAEEKAGKLRELVNSLQGELNQSFPGSRMNRRGAGAFYTIDHLTDDHKFVLTAMWQRDAFDYDHGLTSGQIDGLARGHSLGGRLSEMQNVGCGLVTSLYNEVELKDDMNNQYRSKENRWWIKSRWPSLEDLLSWHRVDQEPDRLPMELVGK